MGGGCGVSCRHPQGLGLHSLGALAGVPGCGHEGEVEASVVVGVRWQGVLGAGRTWLPLRLFAPSG